MATSSLHDDRLLLGPPSQFVDQSALAHPRFTLDGGELTCSRDRFGQAASQGLELLLAPRQGCQAAPTHSRFEAAHGGSFAYDFPDRNRVGESLEFMAPECSLLFSD